MRPEPALVIPLGGACRLFVVPSDGFVLVAASTPAGATLAALNGRGGTSVLVTHAAGVTWPDADADADGVALGREVLNAGGTVALQFPTLVDALACKRRLEGRAA